jgi:NAD(P)H-quinone oxidoreductase subunit 5
VLRFSGTYLDGEAQAGPVHRLDAADARLVYAAGDQSGTRCNWCWPGSRPACFLHKLLLFYPERVEAQRAARKKWIVSRAGDAR